MATWRQRMRQRWNRLSGWRRLSTLLAVVLPLAIAFVAVLYVLGHPEKGFVFTERWSALAALLALLLVSWLADILLRAVVPGDPGAQASAAAAAAQRAQAIASQAANQQAAVAAGDAIAAAAAATKTFRRAGIKALVVGTDGRVSTSKVQAVLWTYAVLYVLTILLVAGRVTIQASHCGATGQPKCAQPAADSLKGAFDSVVAHDLQPEYFALLGIPLGAAVAAKALTTGKVASGDLVKPPTTQSGVGPGLAEVISNDRGETDTFDFQYAAFNLLTLAYFFVQFSTHPADGLPAIPATLLVLSGVSGATYTAKKALETSVGPAITTASPTRIVLVKDPSIVVVGTGFLSPGRPATTLNGVLLDGRPLVTAPSDWSSTRVTASFPSTRKEALKAAGFRARSGADLADLVVRDDLGNPSTPFKVEVATPDNW